MKLQLTAETVMDGMAASQDPGQAEQVVWTNLACTAGAELRLVGKRCGSRTLSRSGFGGPRLAPACASTSDDSFPYEVPPLHHGQVAQAGYWDEVMETGRKSGHE